MQAQATLTNPIIANIFDGHAALCPSYKSNDVNQIASLTRQEILGDMFYTGSMGYFAQLNALTHIAAISSNAHYQLASGYGTFGYEPNVDYVFGMPIGIRAGGISLDIPINVITATNDGNKENKKNFKIQTGLLMSALEHSTPEQMFNDPANPTEAISAVKALQKASAAGQRIYQITQANIDSVMPNLNLGAGSEQEIIASVAAGLEVITHTDQVSVPGYVGEGYIIIDPETGDGAYKIGGGGNGGAYIMGALHGAVFGLLAIGLATGAMAALVVVLAILFIASFLAAIIVIGEQLGEKGWDCFNAGFMVGAGAALTILGAAIKGKKGSLISTILGLVHLTIGAANSTSEIGECF